jgi:hypothetical protein
MGGHGSGPAGKPKSLHHVIAKLYVLPADLQQYRDWAKQGGGATRLPIAKLLRVFCQWGAREFFVRLRKYGYGERGINDVLDDMESELSAVPSVAGMEDRMSERNASGTVHVSAPELAEPPARRTA